MLGRLIRRWLHSEEAAAATTEREREEQRIMKDLHEAAGRVHYIELSEAVMRRDQKSAPQR